MQQAFPPLAVAATFARFARKVARVTRRVLEGGHILMALLLRLPWFFPS